jgi:hypothetical protein
MAAELGLGRILRVVADLVVDDEGDEVHARRQKDVGLNGQSPGIDSAQRELAACLWSWGRTGDAAGCEGFDALDLVGRDVVGDRCGCGVLDVLALGVDGDVRARWSRRALQLRGELGARGASS